MHRPASVLCLSLALAAPVAAQARPKPEVTTVSHVDLDRYLGKWYEIARLPRWFQRACVSDTVAVYSREKLADGVRVVNSCRTKDATKTAKGYAKAVPGANNSKFDVTFMPPFSGDYWIIGMAPDYCWSVVGSSNRKSLWILSRTPHLTAQALKRATATARTQGFPIEKLLHTPHTAKGDVSGLPDDSDIQAACGK